MKEFFKYFIDNPTWSNVFKIIIIGFGAFILFFSTKTSYFPEVESRTINISVTYPSASAEEIEKGVILQIEDNLLGVQGIERFQSTSKENIGLVTIDVLENFDTDKVLDDVKNAIDRINSFPVGIEKPIISKRPEIQFAYSFAIYGDVDLKTLKNIAREAEDDLRSINGISEVKITGLPNEEIVFYIKQSKLRELGISFDQISKAIKSNNLDLSAGTIKTSSEEIQIRLEDKEYFAQFFEDIIILTKENGEIIRLSDIGDIKNTWEEKPQRTYFNDKICVVIEVSQILGEDILAIADNCRNYVDKFNNTHKNVKAEMVNDATINLRDRINMLVENGLMGSVLVILCLTLFLNWRIAFWVAVSIPFSFMGLFIVAYFFGITINIISLFGCIIVVGILVDDGIVVAEQIYQNYEAGQNPLMASIYGSTQVINSVIFAVLTTIVAFIPFFYLEAPGPRFSDIAFVVIVTLCFSLFEVLFILPVHLSHSKALRMDPNNISVFRRYINKGFNYFRDNIYAPILKFFLKHNYFAISIYISFTILTIMGFKSGYIKTTFFPNIEPDNFTVNIELTAGTRDYETKSILDKIEKEAWKLNDSIVKSTNSKDNVILKIKKNVAQAVGRFGVTEQSNSNQGSLQVYMASNEVRSILTLDFAALLKESVGPIDNLEKAEFGATSFFGKPVSITLTSRNLDELKKAKSELKVKLKEIKEIRDVTDNDPSGQKEIIIKLKPKAYLLGLNSNDVIRQIRQGFYGEEVQRIQRGRDEIKVWLKLEENERTSLVNLEDFRIRNSKNQEFPFSELADYKIERGSIFINHIDGKREITVDSELKSQKISAVAVNSKINEEILTPLLKKYNGISTVLTGQKFRQSKFANGLIYVAISLIIMYLLIVLSFNSFTQAFVVFLLIPLGLFGAVWGHVMNGQMISMMSYFGMFALTGIIVNDAIVLTNQFNDNLREGLNFADALFSAATSRFRPIFLTTITTVLGLLPLIFEKSVQAQFLIPMAISVAFGLMFATIFVLIILPSLIVIANSIRRFNKWLLTGKWLSKEEVEPAYISNKIL